MDVLEEGFNERIGVFSIRVLECLPVYFGLDSSG